MANNNRPQESPSDREIVIARIINAPRELVWQAWTDPAHLAQWWGPHDFTNPVCEVDVRPGGAIRIEMRGPDGTVYPMTGEFREVIEPERLVFVSSVPDGSGRTIFEVLHTVTLAGEGSRTKLTLAARVIHWTPEADRYLGGMEAGWTQSLERLDAHLAGY